MIYLDSNDKIKLDDVYKKISKYWIAKRSPSTTKNAVLDLNLEEIVLLLSIIRNLKEIYK